MLNCTCDLLRIQTHGPLCSVLALCPLDTQDRGISHLLLELSLQIWCTLYYRNPVKTFPVAASSSGRLVCTSDWAARVFQSRRGEAGPCHRKALCRCLLLPGGCTSAGLGSERRPQTPPIALPLLSLVGFFLYCFKYQMICVLGRLYFISHVGNFPS